MNTNNLASLVTIKNLITIKVQFAGTAKLYTYKTTDKTIKVGDEVVVETISGLKLTAVIIVDKVADLSKSIDYKWIVQKVDFSEIERLEELEKDVADKLRQLEQEALVNNAKQALADKLGIDVLQLEQELKANENE